MDVNRGYFAFKRYNDLNEILVFMNRRDDRTKIYLPYDYVNEDVCYRFKDSNKDSLDAYGGLVLRKKK